MKKAVNIYFTRADTKKKLDAIKELGFDGVMLTMCDKIETMTIEEQIDYCARIGLEVVSVHCEYTDVMNTNFWNQSDEENECFSSYIKQIERLGKIGKYKMILHFEGTTKDNISDSKMHLIQKLVDAAKKANLTVCIENLHTEELVDLIFNSVKGTNLKMCYDVGHRNCFHPKAEFVKKYASKIVCNHLHNNNGREDEHKNLFHGVLDVKSLSKELAKISKNCEYATLEVKNRDPKADFVQYLAEAKKSLDLLDEKLFNK